MSHKKESDLKQLTVRGFDGDVELAIRRLARSEAISLNEAVLRLLRKGAGIRTSGVKRDCVGDSLDHLAGTWSAEEAHEFDAATSSLEQIDAELWKKRSRTTRRRR